MTKLLAWNISIAVGNILRFDGSKPQSFQELFPERVKPPKSKPISKEDLKEQFAAHKLVLVE